MQPHPPTRYLLRAKDRIDARYRDPLDVAALAQVAHLSQAHFSREFRRAFGGTPHQYLLTRRLERAAGQDVSITLLEIPGPPVFDAETQAALKTLLAKGALGGLFFAADDIHATYEELKGRGVEFSQEPTQQPYGIDAGFRDTSGNQMRVAQLS